MYLLLGLIVSLLSADFAAADVPWAINYQGRLTDTEDQPVEGSVSIEFTIYDAATGGNSKWTETHSAVTVTGGLFNVLLGSINPITDTVFSEGPRFLGIRIGGDPEIIPRSNLVTVPWAFRVSTVDSASGGTVVGDVIIVGSGQVGAGHAVTGAYSLTTGMANVNSADFGFVAGRFNQATNTNASVTGGSFNRAQGQYSVVSGGGGATPLDGNVAEGSYSAVSGGRGNTAEGAAAVGGGENNAAEGHWSVVNGGANNIAGTEYAVVGGGQYAYARGQFSVVAGGGGPSSADSNLALGPFASVGGGRGNVAADSASTVGGGVFNNAEGVASYIGGGVQNHILGDSSVIGGGTGNVIEGSNSFIGGGGMHPDGQMYNGANGANYVLADFSSVVGGADNYVDGDGYSSILGGERNRVSECTNSWVGGGLKNWVGGDTWDPTVYNSVVCGGELNKMLGSWSFCGAGFDNEVFGNASAIVSGGYLRTYEMGNDRWIFINQIDTNAAYSFIGTGWGNRAGDSCSLVLGGVHNYARGKFSVVVGGGADFDPQLSGFIIPDDTNSAPGDYGAILGGRGHIAGGFASAVGGGSYNRATGDYSVISGGGGKDVSYANTAAGEGSTIGGGADNSALGMYSIIPGGRSCNALGDYSVAFGRNAAALHYGSFVWADANTSGFTSSGNNMFSVRASGGTRILSNSSATVGVWLPSGSGSWTTISDSTLKTNIREVDYSAVLDKVAQLPVSRWNYSTQDESIEHIGPMAQDFQRIFGVGDDDKHISTIDPDGIALAAIKALYEKSKEVDDLKARVEQLEEALLDLSEKP
jgi:hypothetical protein